MSDRLVDRKRGGGASLFTETFIRLPMRTRCAVLGSVSVNFPHPIPARPQGNLCHDAQLQLEPCTVDCRYVVLGFLNIWGWARKGK